MPSPRRTFEIYSELAGLEDQRGDAPMRDRFLILAADAALSLGAHDQAERLRDRLLEHNPHHLLRPYPSMQDALKAPDVAGYVADLRRSYPPAAAGRLLEELLSDEVGVEEQARQVDALDDDAVPNEPAVLRFAEPPPPAGPSVAEAPEVFPYPPEVLAPRSRRREIEPEDSPTGAGVWLSNGLFGLLLLAGVALLVYTLARPFVPW